MIGGTANYSSPSSRFGESIFVGVNLLKHPVLAFQLHNALLQFENIAILKLLFLV
jgi:hypothetical protein